MAKYPVVGYNLKYFYTFLFFHLVLVIVFFFFFFLPEPAYFHVFIDHAKQFLPTRLALPDKSDPLSIIAEKVK